MGEKWPKNDERLQPAACRQVINHRLFLNFPASLGVVKKTDYAVEERRLLKNSRTYILLFHLNRGGIYYYLLYCFYMINDFFKYFLLFVFCILILHLHHMFFLRFFFFSVACPVFSLPQLLRQCQWYTLGECLDLFSKLIYGDVRHQEATRRALLLMFLMNYCCPSYTDSITTSHDRNAKWHL